MVISPANTYGAVTFHLKDDCDTVTNTPPFVRLDCPHIDIQSLPMLSSQNRCHSWQAVQTGTAGRTELEGHQETWCERDNVQNKCMFCISISSFLCCNLPRLSKNICLLCWAGIWCPLLSLACFSFSLAGLVQEGTPAKLWKHWLIYSMQKHKPLRLQAPEACQSPFLHKWGYSNARPVC